MVTIGSGGIPKLGGGGQAMDILTRLGLKRGAGAAQAGGFGAPPTAAPMPAAATPQISVAAPPMAPSDRPEPMALTSVAPTESSGMGTMAPMQAGKRFTDPTILNRMGDFMNSDRGRAALLRSAGATLQGGLGAGIKAGAEYYDDQKEIEAKQMNWVSEMGLKTRAQDIDQQQVDQTGRYQGAMADNASTQTAVTAARHRDQARHEQTTANIDVMEEGGRNARFDRGDATDNRRIDTTREGFGVELEKHRTPSGTAVLTQDRTDDRYFNPPAPMAGETNVVKTGEFKDGSTAQKTTKSTVPRVTSQEQYDRLPVGSRYTTNNGQTLVKK